MAYLHCHSCGWQQDDFWNKTYNPIRHLLNWESDLLTKNLDEQWTDDKNIIKETGCKTWREIIVKNIENAAQSVREMLFRVQDDFNNNKDVRCPNCGNINWDID